MGRAISLAVRQRVVQYVVSGESVPSVAQKLGISARSARHLVQRFCEHGEAGLKIHYDHCGPQQPYADRVVVERAKRLRGEHPLWGAPLMRVIFKKEFENRTPSVRTLQRWFCEGQPCRRSSRPPVPKQKTKTPHEVWQMDAAEELRLASGKKVSWLRLVDECTEAFLKTDVFPLGSVEHGTGGKCSRPYSTGFFAMGPPCENSRRQRLAVGIDRRLADRVGVVVD